MDETCESIKTAYLYSLCIVYNLPEERKQWLWKIPEVELDDGSEMDLRIDAFEMVGMAHLEKHRNGMNVVCRAERKYHFRACAATECNSRQLVRWSSGWIPLTRSISASYIEPNCYTEHESQHTP